MDQASRSGRTRPFQYPHGDEALGARIYGDLRRVQKIERDRIRHAITGNSLRSRLAPRQPYPETNKVVRRTKLHARELFRPAVFRLREASSAAAVLTVTRDIRPGAAMMIEQALRIFLRALSADFVIRPR